MNNNFTSSYKLIPELTVFFSTHFLRSLALFVSNLSSLKKYDIYSVRANETVILMVESGLDLRACPDPS